MSPDAPRYGLHKRATRSRLARIPTDVRALADRQPHGDRPEPGTEEVAGWRGRWGAEGSGWMPRVVYRRSKKWAPAVPYPRS